MPFGGAQADCLRYKDSHYCLGEKLSFYVQHHELVEGSFPQPPFSIPLLSHSSKTLKLALNISAKVSHAAAKALCTNQTPFNHMIKGGYKVNLNVPGRCIKVSDKH